MQSSGQPGLNSTHIIIGANTTLLLDGSTEDYVIPKGQFVTIGRQSHIPTSSSLTGDWPDQLIELEVIISSMASVIGPSLGGVPTWRGSFLEIYLQLKISAEYEHRQLLNHQQARLSKEYLEPIGHLVANVLGYSYMEGVPLDLSQVALVPCELLQSLQSTIPPSSNPCVYMKVPLPSSSDPPIVSSLRNSMYQWLGESLPGNTSYTHIRITGMNTTVTDYMEIGILDQPIKIGHHTGIKTDLSILRRNDVGSIGYHMTLTDNGWTEETVPLATLSTVALKRHVAQTGFHRLLVTTAELSFSNDLQDVKDCRIALMEFLPSTLYIDLNEVKTRGYPQITAYRDIDVELPSFLSTQHPVIIYSDWSILMQADSQSQSKFVFNVSIPLHLRYQAPSLSSSYRNASLDHPAVFYQCRDRLGQPISDRDIATGWYRPVNGSMNTSDWLVPVSLECMIGCEIVMQMPIGQ
eukprot:Ihof_evm13s139 gene=Ihof_evmTU13s139